MVRDNKVMRDQQECWWEYGVKKALSNQPIKASKFLNERRICPCKKCVEIETTINKCIEDALWSPKAIKSCEGE